MFARQSVPVVLALLSATLTLACGGASSGPPPPDTTASRSAARRKPADRKTGRGLTIPDIPTFLAGDVKVSEFPDGPPPSNPILSMTGQRAAWTTQRHVAYLDGEVVDGADSVRGGMFSPNGQYFAYVSTDATADDPPTLGTASDDEAYVVVGDVQFGPHQRLQLLAVQDDGAVQYLAGRSGSRAVYIDDVAGPSFQRIDRIDLVRHEDQGSVVAYRALGGDQQCAVVGVEADCHAMVGRPVLSPDGAKIAYTAADKLGALYVVVDGQRAADTHKFIDWRIAVGDQDMLAYVAQAADGGRQVSINGKLGTHYERVRHLTLGARGKTVAYAALADSTWRLVLGTSPQKPVQGEIKKIALGPTEANWAMVVQDGVGTRLVTPRGEGAPYRSVNWLTLRNDGNAAAYVGQTKTGFVAVFGESVSEPYDEIGDLRFLAGGGTAYVARRETEWFVVTSGAATPNRALGPYDDVGPEQIIAGTPQHNYTTSPDGTRLVFRARRGPQWRAVIDGVEGPLYDEIWGAPFAFEPDGARVGYLARTGRELWWRVQAPPPR